jgi:signal transduction histidine kinase/DNA-binding response OmpR family regulator/ligand-binding sensor domain-containing protein
MTRCNLNSKMWPAINAFFLIMFLFQICSGLFASPGVKVDDYIGLNYIENYSPEDYKLQPQNWCIVQDKRGIIYAANPAGLLEYDGVSWRTISVPNNSARSLAIDNNGIIYVGGKNEIGVLEPYSNGTLEYKSLLDHVKDHQKNFSYVWRTHATKEGIYFRTSEYLFRWDTRQKKLGVWKTEKGNPFLSSFACNGKLLIQQRNVGLMQMVNDSLQLLPGSETFATVKIYMIAQYNTRKLLIVTLRNGFYIYDRDSNTLVPFPAVLVDEYLKQKEFYYGIRLSNGDFALATNRGGLVVIDSQGKLKKVFTKDSGLQNDSVKHVFEDIQGNLWLALEKGISKIEYASPICIFDDNRSNLPGLVLAVAQHGPGNNLYVGTTRGLYFLKAPSSTKFRQVPGISQGCFSILSIGDSVLAATQIGVFRVDDKNIKQRVVHMPSYALLPSPRDPKRIWVGTFSGMFSITHRENGQWIEERQFIKEEPIRTIVEEPDGNLWLGTGVRGALKIDFSIPGDIRSYVVTRYDTSHGLPPGTVRVFMAAGHVMFATDSGIFRFNKKDKTFIPDDTLGNQFISGSREVFRIAEDKKKNIWLHSANRNIQAIPQKDGTFDLNEKPFLRIPPVGVNAIYPAPDGNTIWFASNDGLIRYDTTVEKKYRRDFSTFIRKVVVDGTLVFDGYQTGIDAKSLFPIIPYKDRNLRFEFAAPFFEAESEIHYHYFLEGYDKDWSEWSKEPQIAYTNLDAGVYTFWCQAKNVYDSKSGKAVFKFKVLPPWYKAWWAFLLYAAAIILMIFIIVKWRSWKLVQEKQRLEQVVKERTKEINDKNQQLEEQSEKLKEMNKVKSRFFANISHEFRTPLTLIMGPLEQMLSNCQDNRQYRKFNLMRRNSLRLLNLINQLLDLSKFDSGRMKLQAVRQNSIPFLKSIVDSFTLAANQNELDLVFHSETGNITPYFDPEKLEHVMCNLLINAVKFTPPGGKITVSAAVAPGDFMEIVVRDTGSGIPREQLEYIFDRFYQAEEPSRDHQLKGTGIGLALTRELVNLHHGKIDVHSRTGENSGTEFIIRLPIGNDHLKPDEIADSSQLPPGGETYSPHEIPAAFMIEEEKEEESEPGTIEANEKDIILVVEDSADVREYIRGALKPTYMVVEAKNGEQGIKKARETIPDLIISDVMMPGIDGYELSRMLKKEVLTSHIPLILLTAKAAEEDILEGLETGADDYITKPFNTKILCARIKNLIELRRQLQQNLKREMTLQPVKTSVSSVDREFLKDLHQVLEKNLSETDFNVERMGKKLYMSRATLYRKIMGLTGETPTEYIRAYRLKRGAELLKNNYGTVLEVALEVGFSSSAYFTKCFKEKFHQLPSGYLGE